MGIFVAMLALGLVTLPTVLLVKFDPAGNVASVQRTGKELVMNVAPTGVTSSKALEPENPVKYRTLGSAVTRRPSIFSARSRSLSAPSRSCRALDIGREPPHEAAQCELVTHGAKAGDHSHGGGGVTSDFGLARALADFGRTEPSGSPIGTTRYLSPEHWLQVFRTFYGPINKAFAALENAVGRPLR